MSEKICFESRRVGKIEVSEEDIVTFEPLPGFPGNTRYVVVEHSEGSELAWLVSLDDPDLAFVVAAPWAFFPHYDPPVEREHLAILGIEKKEEFELLSIVTLVGKSINLNLAAPLLINVSTRKGIQVISDDPRYTTRAPIPGLDKESKDAPVSATEAAGSAETAPAGP